jgi:hypothetical protein
VVVVDPLGGAVVAELAVLESVVGALDRLLVGGAV